MNKDGIVPIVVALALVIVFGVGLICGNCGIYNKRLLCHGVQFPVDQGK